MKKSDTPIVVEQKFTVPTERLWSAITQLDEMVQWFFENIPEFQPKAGFATEFEVHSEERTFTHNWKVTEVLPKKRIVYNWKYKEYPGNSFVTFAIEELENGCKLQLTHEVVEDFPKDIPEFKRESCQGGWDYFIGENLKIFLSENT